MTTQIAQRNRAIIEMGIRMLRINLTRRECKKQAPPQGDP